MRRVAVVAAIGAASLGLLARPSSLVTERAIAQEPQQPEAPRRANFAMTADRAEAFAEAGRLGLDYLPGEVLVKFKDGVSAEGQNRALFGLRDRPAADQLEWAGPVALLRGQSERDGYALARRLMAQPEVEYAEPNFIYQKHIVPTDPSYASRQWNMTAIDMPRAWDIHPEAGRGVVVAVIDTGVSTSSQSLAMKVWTGSRIEDVTIPVGLNPDLPAARRLPGRDFVFFAAGEPVVDMDGHGTHVASTIAQEANNNLSGVGVAFGATVLPLKVCVGYWEFQFLRSARGTPGYEPLTTTGGCASSGIQAAIRYAADNGAKVINLSLGGPTPSTLTRDAIAYAVSRGVFVAISMGNDFEDGNPTSYPAAYAAEMAGVVAVAATGTASARSYYSSTGAHAEIAAPGGDRRAGGTAGLIWQATLFPPDQDPVALDVPRFDRYADVGYQGTSMASPHVAGVAALLMARGITQPADIEAVMTKTARDLGTAGRDNDFGFGLIQPRAALFGMGIRR